jgi:integrase
MAAVIELPQSPFWAKRKKQPRVRQPNDASRSRQSLIADKVKRIIAATRRSHGRLGERDALLSMMVHRHGLRASELRAIGRKPYHHHQGRKLSA